MTYIFLNVSLPRTLELFVESLLTKSAQITQARNAKTLTPSHMKQCILSESRFDFLKDLVKNIPDASTQEDNESANLEMVDFPNIPEPSVSTPPARNISQQPPEQENKLNYTANFYTEQSTSKGPSVIQYGASSKISEPPKIDFSINSLVSKKESDEPKIHIDLTNIIQQPVCTNEIPALIPMPHNNLYQGNSDNLCIDEDYDN